ncbi:unnamed protein product [Ilex paraguariensis]|uniref:Uncharacterized protein n=1 Tax=Ilex paraguariensis TaxID=185542 RepID=A0ABC8T0F9_9AQUA
MQPLVYGRAPTPAGMVMLPMLLPDGRIGYVMQQQGAQPHAPPSHHQRASSRSTSGSGGKSQGSSDWGTHNNDGGQGRSHGDLSTLTIDDSIIAHPNIYLNSAMEVHSTGAILDYTVKGGDFFAPPVVLPFFPTGKIIGGPRSDATCMCTEFPMVFLIICAVFALKILRNPLAR